MMAKLTIGDTVQALDYGVVKTYTVISIGEGGLVQLRNTETTLRAFKFIQNLTKSEGE